MEWLEAVKDIGSFFKNTLENFFSMGTILGLLAIIISIQSLNYSKRSFLVKDSYDPLLNNLKKQSETGINDTKQFNLDFLMELKDSYMFYTFEKKDRLLINSIIDKAKAINEFKIIADNQARNAAEQVILEKLPEWKEDNQILIEVELQGSREFYSTIIAGNLFMAYELNQLNIMCHLGQRFKGVRNEEVGEEEFDEITQTLPLSLYIRNTFDLSNVPEEYRALDTTRYFLDSLEKSLQKKFKENVDFNSVQKNTIIYRKM